MTLLYWVDESRKSKRDLFSSFIQKPLRFRKIQDFSIGSCGIRLDIQHQQKVQRHNRVCF